MSSCRALEDYLAGTLGDDAAEAFEEHLLSCFACTEEVAAADGIDRQLLDYWEGIDVPAATTAAGKRLMLRDQTLVGERTGMRRVLPRIVGVGLAAAAVLLLGIWVLFAFVLEPAEELAPTIRATAPGIQVLSAEGATIRPNASERSAMLTVGDGGHLEIAAESDMVELASNSRLRVVTTGRARALLELLEGTVTVDAEQRASGESLTVEAGEYRVSVIGTRFAVSIQDDDAVAVEVFEGVVVATGSDETERRVAAGDRLVMGGSTPKTAEEVEDESEDLVTGTRDEEPESDAPEQQAKRSAAAGKAVFDEADVRRRIREGDLKAARALLREHLRRSPGDADAWMLLAECERKSGNWQDAVSAYGRVIDVGDSRKANRARFKSAVVLQDKLKSHRRAASMLEQYLSQAGSGSPLEAEAMFRRAKSLLALGRTKAAHGLFEEILERHSGTPAAVQTRKLLGQIDESDKGEE